MNFKELFEGVEPKMPGAPEGIQIMTPQQFVASAGDMPGEESEEGVAEVSDATLTSYLTKLDKDNLKHRMDPTKRSDAKRMKSGPNFVKAFTKLDNRKQGVAEADDPINYNAAITGSYYESQDPLARIKSLALRK